VVAGHSSIALTASVTSSLDRRFVSSEALLPNVLGSDETEVTTSKVETERNEQAELRSSEGYACKTPKSV